MEKLNCIVEAVKCGVCGKLHDIDKGDYLTVEGNIYYRMEGGLVGNNISNDGKICRQAFCVPCFIKVVIEDLKG